MPGKAKREAFELIQVIWVHIAARTMNARRSAWLRVQAEGLCGHTGGVICTQAERRLYLESLSAGCMSVSGDNGAGSRAPM